MKRVHLLPGIFATLLLLSGCLSETVPHDPHKILPPVPEQWVSPHESVSPTDLDWLADFSSDHLTELLHEADGNSFELQVVAARLAAARSRAIMTGADLWPQADIGLNASRQRTVSGGTDNTGSRFGLNGTIRWEIDLWERLSRAEQAAIAEVEAAAADYAAARLSLRGKVARGWIRLTEADLQVRLAERTRSSFARSLQVVEDQYRRGLSLALDLRLARANVAAAKSQLKERQRERDALRRDLETLLGRYPAGRLFPAAQLPTINRPVPVGLPADLLTRRPDLRAAENKLFAADHRLAGANNNWLPGLVLTAGGGTASEQLRNLLDWDNLVWSLAASLGQPLFTGGRLDAERGLAAATANEQLATYASSVIIAFREVETALAAETYLTEQHAALREAAGESLAAVTLAEASYGQGLTGIVTLLEAQRRAFASESNRLRISRLRLENRIDLYLALGGSFERSGTAGHVKVKP